MEPKPRNAESDNRLINDKSRSFFASGFFTLEVSLDFNFFPLKKQHIDRY